MSNDSNTSVLFFKNKSLQLSHGEIYVQPDRDSNL
jgi:hypothetical protein